MCHARMHTAHGGSFRSWRASCVGIRSAGTARTIAVGSAAAAIGSRRFPALIGSAAAPDWEEWTAFASLPDGSIIIATGEVSDRRYVEPVMPPAGSPARRRRRRRSAALALPIKDRRDEVKLARHAAKTDGDPRSSITGSGDPGRDEASRAGRDAFLRVGWPLNACPAAFPASAAEAKKTVSVAKQIRHPRMYADGTRSTLAVNGQFGDVVRRAGRSAAAKAVFEEKAHGGGAASCTAGSRLPRRRGHGPLGFPKSGRSPPHWSHACITRSILPTWRSARLLAGNDGRL